MSSVSSNNKRIARNTAFLYIRMAVVMVITLYTTRVVLRVLGVVDYGIYNVVCGFVTMFNVFNTCLNTGANRFYNIAIGKKEIGGVKRVFNAALAIQVILILIIVVIVESVGLWYVNNKMVIPAERLYIANWIFQFSVFSLVMLVLQTPFSAALLSYEKMDYYALVSIVDVLLKLGFVIALQYVSVDKLLFYGILMMIVSIVNFLMYFIYCRKHFDEMKTHLPIDKQTFKELFSFSAWSLLDPITMMAKGQGSNMVLNFYFGPVVNAAYGIANQISHAIDGFTQNIAVAFRPQIIQSYSCGEYDRTKKLMYSMSKINYMLHLMLILPIVIEIKYILNLWLGDDYPVYAVSFAPLVMIIATINCLHAPISTVMVATGKIKKIKTVSLIVISSVIPISIVCFVLGLPPVATFIVLLCLTIINIATSVIIMCQTFPTIKIGNYMKSVIWPCMVFSVLVIILPITVSFIMSASFIRLILLCVVSLISAVFVGYVIVMNKDEKILAKTIANDMRNKLFRKR